MFNSNCCRKNEHNVIHIIGDVIERRVSFARKEGWERVGGVDQEMFMSINAETAGLYSVHLYAYNIFIFYDVPLFHCYK